MASPTSTSTASPSPQPSRPSSSQHGDASEAADSVPVETLVQHLLDAKRSLSSMTLVLRANELVTAARLAHEESVILGAQSQFLRRGITEQARLLLRARRSMNRTYDSGKREFKQIIKNLDATNGRLEDTMNILRARVVESAFRPKGEEKRNLLDFVDVVQVDTMRNALKENIAALQATQTSFDGDLLRFDTDLRTLNKTLQSTPSPLSPSASNAEQPIAHILASMMHSSHDMAEHLTSLTRHFDLCVTAVRTTEGGAALAKRKAAEVTQSQGDDVVSISGVMAEQELHMTDVEPISGQDRAQMLQVVVQDASEVSGVVQEINEALHGMEDDFARLEEQTNRVRLIYLTTLDAFHVLQDIGSRLQSYIAAETEFRDRWIEEHETISDKMVEMEQLRMFYENYASSYDSLILEVERRKSHEEKMLSIWRKAKESVDKIIEADRRQRETFRQEIAEYIPTDLWPGMDDGMTRWEIVPVQDEVTAQAGGSAGTPALDRSVIQAAAMRLGRNSTER
ncbi:kinase activator [Pseudomassariella vexata]|uniref:Autophagy-related protein 17 n=1 Tax=Pseudomassariella vexata TaxID=1141098 RepID=A0A1Y2DW77_9PEZI|nr:kinase activator [Pseudomassariella vexata]ORY63364.1 kinase activator [Pseudomassariella vexata]